MTIARIIFLVFSASVAKKIIAIPSIALLLINI